VRYAPCAYDGAFGSTASSHQEILSEEFLDLLTPDERQALVIRRIHRTSGTRGFYELLGPAGPPLVVVAGLKSPGWVCKSCGYRCLIYRIEEDMNIQSFIAKTHLPSPMKGIFTVGIVPEIYLVATEDRWRELVGKRGTRGFVSRMLGVVSEEDVVCEPELCEYVATPRAVRTQRLVEIREKLLAKNPPPQRPD
jgi:hypothetical protein